MKNRKVTEKQYYIQTEITVIVSGVLSENSAFLHRRTEIFTQSLI